MISTTPNGHAPARKPYALDIRPPAAKARARARCRLSNAYVAIMKETALTPDAVTAIPLTLTNLPFRARPCAVQRVPSRLEGVGCGLAGCPGLSPSTYRGMAAGLPAHRCLPGSAHRGQPQPAPIPDAGGVRQRDESAPDRRAARVFSADPPRGSLLRSI